jgi:hypothetical protein
MGVSSQLHGLLLHAWKVLRVKETTLVLRMLVSMQFSIHHYQHWQCLADFMTWNFFMSSANNKKSEKQVVANKSLTRGL